MSKRSSSSPSQALRAPRAAAASGPDQLTQPMGNDFAQAFVSPSATPEVGILDPWLDATGPEEGSAGLTVQPGAELSSGPPETGASEAASLVLEQTAADFNANFEPVKHGLGGTGPNGDLMAQDLDRLFTADQLGKLVGFLRDGTVPRRMFNGVQNTSMNTPQRRILLSSHILNTGTFDPATILHEAGEDARATTDEGAAPAAASVGPDAGRGEDSAAPAEAQPEEQDNRREIAANSCRHWAMMVYGYAGLPVPGEGADGLWHTHDATGGINLGGTAPDQTEGSVGSAGSLSGRDGDWAPFFGAGVNAADIFHPGDWLQLAWSSGGGHSVVLLRVVRENRDSYWIDYYSQSRNGLDSERRLDANKRISKRLGQGTVTFSHRAMSQATDPQSASELFGGLHETNREGDLRSASPNQRYIERRGPDGVQVEDAGPVTRWLCEELVRINRGRLDELGERLTAEQRALMDRMNVAGTGDLRALEQLVRVNQRLVHTIENDAHTRMVAAAEDTASPQYRIGRFGGRGNGLYGMWDSRDEDGVVRVQRRDKASAREIAASNAERTSGELEDMPDRDRIDWARCPAGAPRAPQDDRPI